MIPDGETTNINTLLFLMASLSPKARDALETESYRFTSETDQVTERYILEDAFKNILMDLETLGLTFSIDYTDYVEDIGKLSKFIQLSQLLLPNGLYPLLKTDSQIRDLIESILSGSLGDGGTVIQTYLTELGGLDGNFALRPYLSDFLDQVYLTIEQTSTFTDYLENLFNLYKEEVPSPPTDGERHTKYRDVLRKFIGCMSDATNLFERWDKYNALTTIQNFVIRDLVSPDNFIPYSYLFLESKYTLPEELHNGYDRKWYHYEVSNPWCFAYYKVRNKEKDIPEEYRVMIYAVALARSELIKSKYNELIKDINALYGDESYHELISSLFVE